MQENLRQDAQSNKTVGLSETYGKHVQQNWHEWDGEGDRKDWIHKGVRCRIERCSTLKTLCGYVHIAPGSALYDKQYYEVALKVHGDLSYAGPAYWENTVDSGWWLGFDCSHYTDFIPSRPTVGTTYRNMNYVQAQCEQLVEQVLVYKEPTEEKAVVPEQDAQQFIICAGNVVDGIEFYGPFTYEEAETYLDLNYCNGMIMADLNAPESISKQRQTYQIEKDML